VPALLPDRDGSSTVAVSPDPTPSGASSPSASAYGPNELDPDHPWALRGDLTLLRNGNLETFQRDWSTRHPGNRLTPLYVQKYEPSQQVEVVFVGSGDGGARWGVATSSESGSEILVDEPLPDDSSALMTPLPGDEVPRLLVIAAPSTGAVEYAPDGKTFRDIQITDVVETFGSPSTQVETPTGIGVTSLEGDTSHDMVRVLDGNGDIDRPVFLGPAPDAAPASADGKPANYLDWQAKTTIDPAVANAARSWFADRVTAPSASDVRTSVLLAGMDSTGRTVVLAQGWVRGNDARTFLWWGNSDGSGGDGRMGKVTDIGPAAQVALVPAQGKGVETLVVVGAPGTAHVGYTSTATGTFNTVEGGGAVMIDRSPDSVSQDRIRLTDAAGKLLYRDDVAQAVCATMGCS
jgi:hypothetical protein